MTKKIPSAKIIINPKTNLYYNLVAPKFCHFINSGLTARLIDNFLPKNLFYSSLVFCNLKNLKMTFLFLKCKALSAPSIDLKVINAVTGVLESIWVSSISLNSFVSFDIYNE